MTGLPFVFAAWVAVVPLQEGFIKRFVVYTFCLDY